MEVNFASRFVNQKDIDPKICQLIALRNNQNFLKNRNAQLNTVRDHHAPIKAQSFSSADEYMETFEVDASDDGCIPRLGIKQDETVDNESDVEKSGDWFHVLGNEDVVDYEDLIANLSLLDENGVPMHRYWTS